MKISYSEHFREFDPKMFSIQILYIDDPGYKEAIEVVCSELEDKRYYEEAIHRVISKKGLAKIVKGVKNTYKLVV